MAVDTATQLPFTWLVSRDAVEQNGAASGSKVQAYGML
jgi:hypothetical protein